MSEISAIELVDDTPTERRVRVGRRVMATLRVDDVELLGVAVGMTWTDDLAARVARCVAADRLRRRALGLLAKREYGRRELEERLTRSADAELVRGVVDDLVTRGCVDDRRYAEQLTRELADRRGLARAALIERLVRRGIDEDLARVVVEQELENVDPLEDAERIARDRLRTLVGVEPATRTRRIAGALARRGFDEDVVMQVIRRLDLPTGGSDF